MTHGEIDDVQWLRGDTQCLIGSHSLIGSHRRLGSVPPALAWSWWGFLWKVPRVKCQTLSVLKL